MAYYDTLTEAQNEAAKEAAKLVFNARKEAAEMLRAAGIEPPVFTGPCQAVFFEPRPPRGCGCVEYSGDGGPCRTRFEGPDLGSGPITITCQHDQAEHLI